MVLGVWTFNSAASYVISPDAAETQRCLAKQLAIDNHRNEAIAKLEPLLAAHPDDDLTRILLAKLNRDGRLLEVPPGQCERYSRYYFSGLLLASEKRTDQACHAFQTALRLVPDDCAARLAMPKSSPRGSNCAWPSTPGRMYCVSLPTPVMRHYGIGTVVPQSG